MTLSLKPRALVAAGLLVASAALPAALSAQAQPQLMQIERRIRDAVVRDSAAHIALLERTVDINSGTMTFAGVRQVGDVLRTALDSLGFETRWVSMPEGVNRAGHLIAEHKGKPGTARLLLIGHLDTVFEGEGEHFVREDTIARGAGTSDMKGGDVVIIGALKAMRDAGVLKDANIAVIFHGDEESEGDPISISRRDIVELAKRSDIALAFEGGSRDNATVARRGASTWILRVTARQAHSAGVFGEGAGYGAIYEAARIIDGFRTALAGQQYLTFNPGVIVGGAQVTFDTLHLSGTAAGKTNIVAPSATVVGDLRFLSEAQKDSARETMRKIVALHLPRTDATLEFQDGYPAMSPTPGNYKVLAVYDTVSQALGYGEVEALDPGRRGAGDVSFVAPYIDGLDGLGVSGGGGHSPNEWVNLNSIPMQTTRAAITMYRLTRMPASAFVR